MRGKSRLHSDGYELFPIQPRECLTFFKKATALAFVGRCYAAQAVAGQRKSPAVSLVEAVGLLR